MRILNYSNVVATLALVVALSAVAIDWSRYSQEVAIPGIFWRLLDVSAKLSDDGAQYRLVSSVHFAVTNTGRMPLFLASCHFATYGFSGAGGIGENTVPCKAFDQEIEVSGSVRIEPGQTRFFHETYVDEVPAAHMPIIYQARGFPHDLVEALEAGEECNISFDLSASGGMLQQNCVFEHNTPIFAILLRTGGGQLLRASVRATSTPDWPWGRLENFITDELDGHMEVDYAPE